MNEKYFCRCCLSEDCYKDMANDYYFGQDTENYCQMLLNIFNINIVINDEQRSLICEECVSKLRNAAAYKKKVLDVQEMLRNSVHLETNGKGTTTNTIIGEADNLDEFVNNSDYSFNENYIKWENFTSDTSQKGKFFVIQLEPNSQKNSIDSKTYSLFKEKCKNEFEQPTDQKNILLDTNYSLNSNNTIDENTGNINLQESMNTAGEQIENDDGTSDFENTDCQEHNVGLYAKLLSSCNDEDIGETSKSKKRKRNIKNIGDTAKKKKKKNENKKEISQSDLRLRYKRQNTLKLIQNSNICLFKSFQNKFGCQHCNMRFTDLGQLKEHSFTHATTKIKSLVNRLKGLSCKNAEISDLKCNICSEKCDDLSKLMDHLKMQHKVAFQGKDHYLVPYKLHDGFKCALCDTKFNTYLRLSIHMNTHYEFTNNVCEICGLSYINRQSLSSHVHSQHREKKCSQCPAIFLTSAARTKHLRQAHGVRNLKSYCNLCSKTFRYSYLVRAHKVKEHDLQRETFSCSLCEKTFWSSINLKLHVRSVHIKERNYPCTKCGMRFFTKCDQHRHERTHEDLRSFCCSYCDAKFKSKDSWRRHLKRQHGHVFEKETGKTKNDIET
ncbi:PR domain zinc finger protein 5-like isoform X1 [Helicoverpa zea]|uniref:PR domain zinc finger protein 5-like isoform X1 n=1 Tax=Helicoverpa zea TaxID=7113 RepID=UPI001F5A5960|nr:PR domain zinc finger protein 5-like isoform X1 [Helicoverpa zea]